MLRGVYVRISEQSCFAIFIFFLRHPPATQLATIKSVQPYYKNGAPSYVISVVCVMTVRRES
jgi:hypothetical protein